MQAQNYDLACTKFAESQMKEPAPGTALNLGECEEHRGHLVAAYEAFTTAANGFTNAEKQKYASGRAEALDKRIPRLLLHASSAVTGLIARTGTKEIPIGTEVRMDPGDIVIVAEAPGYVTKELRASLKEGRSLDVDIGALAARPSAAPPPPPPKIEPRPAEKSSSPLDQRTIGLAVAGVGAAALVVGGVTGIMALDRASTVKDHCDDNLACDSIGYDAAQSGDTLSLVSTITIAAGAAALLGGGILFFTAKKPSSSQTAPNLIGAKGIFSPLRVTF